MYHLTRLNNGLTVATAEMPHMASVSLGLWVGVGGRYEPAGWSGVSHFIEHMLFKGTDRRSARAISEEIEGVGGYLNAFTSEEHCCFYGRMLHDRFGDLLEVLMDMLLRSKFSPGDIVKERTVIKEELAMTLDQPQQHVQELLNTVLWPGQPLGRPLTGSHRTLNALTRKPILDFFRQHYVAPAVVVAAAGRLRHEQILRATRRYARHFRPGPRTTFPEVVERQTRPGLRLRRQDIEQTQIALGFRGVSRHDPRRFTLRMLNSMLGENMSSRLFQAVREDRGLAYSIYSVPSYFADTGDLVISAGLDTDRLPEVLRLILRELRRLKQSPPTAEEMRRARDYAAGQVDLNLESTESQMNWVGESVLNYGRAVSGQDAKKRYDQVTAAEIQALANDLFRPERLNLALVSPLKSTRAIEPLLASVL